jgi:hypothetical protein
MRVPAGVIAVLGVAVLIGGCGGDDEGDESGDEAAAVAAVDDFYAGIADGDGEAACATLSDAGRAELEGGATGLAEGTTCEDAIEQVVELFNEETLQAISEVEPTVTAISGTTATVEATSFNQATTGEGAELEEETIEIDLVKEGEDWKIDGLPENPQA